MKRIKAAGKKIVGYGSPAKATTVLNYYGVNSNILDYIVEDNPLKIGKFLPGVKIPIVGKENLELDRPDVVLVLAWNYFDYIVEKNRDLVLDGIEFVSLSSLGDEN